MGADTVAVAALSLVAAALSPSAPDLPARLTLDGALAIFRERGLDLLIADAAVASAEGDLRAARQVTNPGLSYAFSRITNYDPSQVCPPDAPGGYGGAAACSPNVHALALTDNAALEDALTGKRGLRIEVAEAALRAARMSRADARRVLEFQLKSQYLQAVLARDQLDFALEAQRSWSQTLDLVHVRYQKGAISEADEAKVETAKLEGDQAVRAAEQALLAAKASLAFLLGARDSFPQFDVDADLPHYAVPPKLADATAQALLRDALAARPDLQAAQAQQARAEAAVRQVERARIPDVALQAGLSYAAPGGGPFSSNTVPPTLVVGLSGTLPLLSQQQGEIQKAEAEARAQAAAYEKAKAQVVAEVATAYGSFTASRDLVERMEGRLLDRARTARDLTRFQYEKGAASLLEYLDAQRTFIATNVEYLQDLAGYWTAVAQLEQAVGAPLR